MTLPKNLPDAIRAKALQVASKLPEGNYFILGGKKLIQKENGLTRISIPVGYRYRLIALFDGQTLTAKELCSHERYNKVYCQ